MGVFGAWYNFKWGNENYHDDFFGWRALQIRDSRIKNTDNWGVFKAWKEGKSAKNSSLSLCTDGKILFSYNLLIGYTDSRNKKIKVDCKGFTRTTTNHHYSFQGHKTISRDKWRRLNRRFYYA